MKFALLTPALCLLASCGNRAAPEAKQPSGLKPVKVLQFYAGSGTVARGEQVLICYGVENAKTVRLEPPIEKIAPSFNRCFQYSPSATSEIKLIATSAAIPQPTLKPVPSSLKEGGSPISGRKSRFAMGVFGLRVGGNGG